MTFLRPTHYVREKNCSDEKALREVRKESGFIEKIQTLEGGMVTKLKTPTEKTPYLIWKGSEAWVAKNVRTGVASQGKTRREALENLDEAISLYEGRGGESIESWEEEREFLKELGIDPEEVKRARRNGRELPEFMQ